MIFEYVVLFYLLAITNSPVVLYVLLGFSFAIRIIRSIINYLDD